MSEGTILRRRVLDGEACYRVLGFAGELVLAEVLCSPGLPGGMRVHFTSAAARRMALVVPREDEEPLARGRRLACRAAAAWAGLLPDADVVDAHRARCHGWAAGAGGVVEDQVHR